MSKAYLNVKVQTVQIVTHDLQQLKKLLKNCLVPLVIVTSSSS